MEAYFKLMIYKLKFSNVEILKAR